MAENGVRGVNSGSGGSDLPNGHHSEGKTAMNGNEQKSSFRFSEAIQKYIHDLTAERSQMENRFPLALKLIDEALEKVKSSGRLPSRDQYADVYQQKTIKLSQKVHVPIKDKKFNYVGKLLGPKGNSLRRLQEDTQCKILILGRFSMKDRIREEELRNSSDLKYAHLNLPLHVDVSTIAPPAEAYARMAYALAQIRRYLIPDKHDDIRQEQLRELMSDPEAAKKLTVRTQFNHHNSNHGGAHGHHNSGGGHGGQSSNHYRGGGGSGGGYRPKYNQMDQHHMINGGQMFYRPIHTSNNFHQKNYMAGQRNMMPIMPGAIMTAPTYNGRSHMSNNHINGGGPVAGGGNNQSRYRQGGQYQYNKKN